MMQCPFNWLAAAGALAFSVSIANAQNLIQSSGLDDGEGRWSLSEEFGARVTDLTSGKLTWISCSGSPCPTGSTTSAFWFAVAVDDLMNPNSRAIPVGAGLAGFNARLQDRGIGLDLSPLGRSGEF